MNVWYTLPSCMSLMQYSAGNCAITILRNCAITILINCKCSENNLYYEGTVLTPTFSFLTLLENNEKNNYYISTCEIEWALSSIEVVPSGCLHRRGTLFLTKRNPFAE